MLLSSVSTVKSYNSTVNFNSKIKNKNFAANFAQTQTTEQLKNKEQHNYGLLTLSVLGVYAIGVSAILLKNCKKVEHIKNLTETDKNYLNSIRTGLKKCGINVEIENLKSIVAPDEFKTLIKKFKPEHFQVGMQISEKGANNIPLEKFYKNAIDGNFRVSLHTHSDFSDGKASIEEFLDSARKYADKIAKMNKNDDLPPFTIALTDHDCVNGCQEAIKIIAKNPEKYKNLRFVAGCEFSVMNGAQQHDITGLVLNPFDKNLIKTLNDLSIIRIKTVQDFLANQPEYKGKKIVYEDVAKFEKEYYASKNTPEEKCIENGSGLVVVRHAIKFFYKMTKQDVNFDMVNKLGNKDILPIETVMNAIKANGGFASLTHPTKSFWRYIGDDFILKLKNMGLDGIEVNHQYTPSKITALGKHNNTENADDLFKELTQQYKKIADNNGLFLSGGTDSHEKQIFSREPKITSEILEKIYN